MYTSSEKSGSFHPLKWSTFFDARDGKLHSSGDLVDGSIPRPAFQSGSRFGCLNLYEWYNDALQDAIARGELPADATVTGVRITGIRLYTANSGTEATFNYLAIGGKDNTDESMRAQAQVVNAAGATVNETVSDVNFGQVVNLSLDQLVNSADAHNPEKTFLGWSFTGNSSSSVVWWNPNATNDKQYSSSNTGGSWSPTKVNGFVQNRRDISYQLTDATKTIYPVFASTNTLSFKLTLNGSGSVAVMYPERAETVSATKTYTDVLFGDKVLLSAVGDGFDGWYGANGQLLTNTRDYAVSVFGDAEVTAVFNASAEVTLDPYKTAEDCHSIVWLQRADENAGIAGDESGFYLRAVNSGNILGDSVALSNINDAEGMSEIVCYWSLEDGQLLEAVAPSGYHWEMLLRDGSTVCLGMSNIYRFITSVDIKLICTPNANSCSDATGVIVNEYAVSFDRTTDVHTASVTGQVFTADNEMLVGCGIVMAVRPSRVKVPSFDSPESSIYAAQAWNSSTGQFTVDVDFAPGMARFVRGYAIVKNLDTGAYTLRYSDYVTISF